MKKPRHFVESNKFESVFSDWVNIKVNKLTILSFPGHIMRTDSNTSVSPAVHVKCECGKEFITFFYRVRSGRTPSCGCINSAYKKGDEGSAYDLMNRYKHSAKKRNFNFSLSFDEFYYIIKQNCHYCGVKPLQNRTVKGCKNPTIYNGIDRINSEIGYEFNNCVACCFTCNRAKSNTSYEQFIDYLIRVSNYLPHIKNRDVTVKPKDLIGYGNTVSTTDEVVFVEHSNCALNRSNNVTKSSRNNDCC